MSLAVFHLSVFALNSYTIWYDQAYIDLPYPSKDIEAMPFKARQLFLTFWCLVLQTVYFAVSFLNDIVGSNAISPRNPPLLRRVKDAIFCLAFPVAIYVVLTFWGIYTANKNLIFPDEIERLIPVWVNHVMHTFIVPFIFIELLVTRRNYPTRKFGFRLVAYFISIYTLWIIVVYLKTNIWVYPFLEHLTWSLRFVFCIISTAVVLAIYVFGEKINRLVSPKAKAYANGMNGTKKD